MGLSSRDSHQGSASAAPEPDDERRRSDVAAKHWLGGFFHSEPPAPRSEPGGPAADDDWDELTEGEKRRRTNISAYQLGYEHGFAARGGEAADRAAPAAVIDVETLREAIYVISQRHDWEHTTDREDRTEEIAAEYERLRAALRDREGEGTTEPRDRWGRTAAMVALQTALDSDEEDR